MAHDPGAATNRGTLAGPAIQGLFLTVGSVLALLVVCRDPRSRIAIGRGFDIVIAALCASFVVTALLWTVAGVGAGTVAAIPIGTIPAQPVYFPFTPTESVQTVFGTEFPRFTGLGREPGWMAMYCGIAYFMADMVGLRSRWLKLVLAGLIGCGRRSTNGSWLPKPGSAPCSIARWAARPPKCRVAST